MIGLASRNAVHMSSRNDHRRRERSWERSDRDRDRDRHRDRDRGGDRGRGRGDRYRDSRRRSRSRSPRRGEADRRSGVHHFFSPPPQKANRGQRETGETIITTIGGTLIDETEKIVEGTKDGMTATATGASPQIEGHQGGPNYSLPRG